MFASPGQGGDVSSFGHMFTNFRAAILVIGKVYVSFLVSCMQFPQCSGGVL